jgi:hypothetical protein
MRENINCFQCGRELKPHYSGKLQKYCSLKCETKYKWRLEHPFTPITRKCLCCGQDFTQETNRNKMYCSTKCLRKVFRNSHKNKLADEFKNWREKNKDYLKIKYKEWSIRNRALKTFLQNKRYADILKRTPSYADMEKIKQFYIDAERITQETGIIHHIDHIIPLKGICVSGFHHEGNLQILTAVENLTKSNKLVTG